MSQSFARPIRIRVLHPEAIVALGLAAALSAHADLDVSEATAPAEAGHPTDVDVIVCDPDTGIDMARARARLDRAGCNPRLLVLAPNDHGPAARLALDSGVHGYILRGGPVEEFAMAVRAVASGQRFVSVAVALQMAHSSPRDTLTLREQEVLDLLWRGHCNKAIARELDIAVGTVKAHVKAILSKLSANGRTQAVSVAVERGLVGLAHHRATAGHRQPVLSAYSRYAAVPVAA